MKKNKLKKICIKIVAGMVLTLQLLTIKPVSSLRSGGAEICGNFDEFYDFENT